MINLLIIIIGLSGGVVVGGAYAAFVTMLQIIPRLVHISHTHNHKTLYQNAYIIRVITFTIFYFSDYNVHLSDNTVAIIGLIMGTFIGILSSALAEVINVIPVMSKKLKMKKESKYLGALYYWLIFN